MYKLLIDITCMKCVPNAVTEISAFSLYFNYLSNVKSYSYAKVINMQWPGVVSNVIYNQYDCRKVSEKA